MADDFEDLIGDFDDGELQNSALSLSKLLALDSEENEDSGSGFEKLLGKLNDKDLEVNTFTIASCCFFSS